MLQDLYVLSYAGCKICVMFYLTQGDSGKLVVVQYCSSSDEQKCFIYDKNLGSIVECECQEADILGEFWEQRICFRLQACIPVLVEKDERGMLPV